MSADDATFCLGVCIAAIVISLFVGFVVGWYAHRYTFGAHHRRKRENRA